MDSHSDGSSQTIVVTTHLTSEFPDAWERFVARYPQHRFVDLGEDGDLIEAARDATIVVVGDVDDELLDAAERLRWVMIPFTGVNRLPFEKLLRRGIRVSNNHGNGTIVAERAFSLALALLGRVPEFDRDLRRGKWHRTGDSTKPFEYWTSLRDKPVTMLGCGQISLDIAALLKPFGCRVHGYRRDISKPLPAGIEHQTTDLGEALDFGELVFVNLPLTPETRGLLGADELSRLGRGYLVNVSRGPVVDQAALFDALKEGRLAGAAIDSWYRYPKPWYADRLPGHFPFHELDNVVMSPHAASHAPEGKLGQFDGLLLNLEAILDRGEPVSEVDLTHGY